MTAAQVFTQVLKVVDSNLKRTGFARSKRTFWIQNGDNVGIIDVQKSAKSAADRIIFTLNVGAWSARIGAFGLSSLKSSPPDAADCHWRERIGFLLPDREDKWWAISESDDPTAVNAQLGPVIENVAVPAVVAHINDETLRDEWMTGRSPGLTDIQRLMYLTVLLKELGPRDALGSVVAELRRKSEGKPIEAIVTRHVQKLGLND